MKRTGVRFDFVAAVDRHRLSALAMTSVKLVADVGDDHLTVAVIHTGLVILVRS